MAQLIRELVEGGYVGQLVLLTLIWGGIIILAVQGRDVPTWLIVSGSTVLGWFFRSSAQTIANTRVK